MSQVLGYDKRSPPQVASTTSTLYDLLHNSLVLRNVAPYLPLSCLFNLATSDTALRSLIFSTPGVFRHLDLTRVKSAQFDIEPIDAGGEVWRNVQLDENLTEDEYVNVNATLHMC